MNSRKFTCATPSLNRNTPQGVLSFVASSTTNPTDLLRKHAHAEPFIAQGADQNFQIPPDVIVMTSEDEKFPTHILDSNKTPVLFACLNGMALSEFRQVRAAGVSRSAVYKNTYTSLTCCYYHNGNHWNTSSNPISHGSDVYITLPKLKQNPKYGANCYSPSAVLYNAEADTQNGKAYPGLKCLPQAVESLLQKEIMELIVDQGDVDELSTRILNAYSLYPPEFRAYCCYLNDLIEYIVAYRDQAEDDDKSMEFFIGVETYFAALVADLKRKKIGIALSNNSGFESPHIAVRISL